jgi:two-component system sensor histidine kinase BaeS
MLTNLLTNAAQYCRPGDHVTVRVDRDGSQGLLQVTDTGPGICAASLPHVFDRAWRGPAATVPGSGLGLPIVRALAEAHGGTATLDSTEGVGTTISIRLPGLPSVANPTSVAGESRGQRAGR